MGRWIGVDVGGKRKAFDVALLEDRRVIHLRGRQSVEEVVAWVDAIEPSIVAVDSPRTCAPPGQTHRPAEKRLRQAVCGIRWTPTADKLPDNPYYEWIVEGLRLYDALIGSRAEVIECFPTATWTRLYGERGSRRRAAWSREALGSLDLDGVPSRTNQDQRDAIAAAVTAAAYERGACDRFGDILVPR